MNDLFENIVIDFQGQDYLDLGKKWLLQKKRKPLFLTGPTSSGKTTFIKTLLKGYILCEDDIEELETNLQRNSLLKIACIIECLESLTSNYFEIINKISSKKYSIPVIFTADNAFDQDFKSIKNNCEWIQLKRHANPKFIIKKILENDEIFEVKDQLIDFFLECSSNNIRQSLNSLQFYLDTNYIQEVKKDTIFTYGTTEYENRMIDKCKQKQNEKKKIVDTDVAMMDVLEKDLFAETNKLCNGVFEKDTMNEDNYEKIFPFLHENASLNAANISNASKINDYISFSDLFQVEEINDYALRSTIAESCKGFKKVGKLKFPTLFSFQSNKTSKKKKKILDIYKESNYHNRLLLLSSIYEETKYTL